MNYGSSDPKDASYKYYFEWRKKSLRNNLQYYLLCILNDLRIPEIKKKLIAVDT